MSIVQYLIIDKRRELGRGIYAKDFSSLKKIIAIDGTFKSPQELMEDFDPEKMLMIKEIPQKIPCYFKISSTGKIKPVSSQTLVEENIFHIPDDIVVKKNRLAQKPIKQMVEEGELTLNEPFEYIKNGMLHRRSLDEVIKRNVIKNLDQARITECKLKERIKAEIADRYSIAEEMKITKDFLAWMVEGKPGNDTREKKYLTMQESIRNLKSSYRKAKSKIRRQIAKFEKKQ